MAEQILVERTIHADPAELYDLVSDLPRMGEWSPENRGGTWLNGAEGPVVGARFKGLNGRGWARWSTDVVVTDAQPGERFTFDVTRGPIKIATWDYVFTPDGAKTRVVETWTDNRMPYVGTVVGWFIGVRNRAALNRRNMEATLANLAAAVEV
jgi:uncharacterized protein YndB with AHSA1/START domain